MDEAAVIVIAASFILSALALVGVFFKPGVVQFALNVTGFVLLVTGLVLLVANLRGFTNVDALTVLVASYICAKSADRINYS